MKFKAKRSYLAVYNAKGNKWFTGWAGDVDDAGKHGNLPKHVLSAIHEYADLRLKYFGYSRGRSAANIILVDEEGFRYEMSMSGFDKLLNIVTNPGSSNPNYNMESARVMGSGVWWEGTFIQTKQGQNYFIEPVEVKW